MDLTNLNWFILVKAERSKDDSRYLNLKWAEIIPPLGRVGTCAVAADLENDKTEVVLRSIQMSVLGLN